MRLPLTIIQIGQGHPPDRSARAGGAIPPLRSICSAAPLRYTSHKLHIQLTKALDATFPLPTSLHTTSILIPALPSLRRPW